MKNIKQLLCNVLLIGMAAGIFTSCERRPLVEELETETAKIPVKIDWSQSGITVADATGSGNVHRVSLRFFPKDGSTPFERYLEINVIEGYINVPIGNYSVVVYNESHSDTYWNGRLTFADVNSYSNFSASIVNSNAANYPNYTPLNGETLVVEPLALASWNLDTFTVDEDMVKWSQKTGAPEAVKAKINALTKVVMRRLVYNVTVNAKTENLGSVQSMQGAMRGFARKVYMASATNEDSASTYVVNFGSRIWDDEEEQVHGTATKTFRSFGKLPESTAAYWVNLDVIFVNGLLHDAPLLFNVTDQVVEQANSDYVINVEISLPKVTGDISVKPWEDEEKPL